MIKTGTHTAIHVFLGLQSLIHVDHMLKAVEKIQKRSRKGFYVWQWRVWNHIARLHDRRWNRPSVRIGHLLKRLDPLQLGISESINVGDENVLGQARSFVLDTERTRNDDVTLFHGGSSEKPGAWWGSGKGRRGGHTL